MKAYLNMAAVAFMFLGFFGFFIGAMAVETMPTPMMVRAFGACFVALAGGILCMRLAEKER